MKSQAEISKLTDGVLAHNSADVARAISMVEDRRESALPAAIALLRELSLRGRTGGCHRVGITGPPGVGKSSLVSALGSWFRAAGRSVGVLAVDPSSPRSGGSLLGDRARIMVDPADRDHYVRSMASGGQLGGLARAAGAAVDVLSAAFDLVLIETTGVGQSETDVEHVSDTVVLVIQPASGDVLQFIKSGILEIPDLLVVNKCDLGAVAERAVADLTSAVNLSLEARGQSHAPGILGTSTVRGDGIEELGQAILAHRQRLAASGAFDQRRVEKGAAWAARLFLTRYGEVGVETVGGAAALRAELAKRIGGGASAIEAVRALAPA